MNGEVGSIARTAMVRSRARAAPTSAAARLDFPTPGDPVRPTVYARPLFGYRASESAGRPSAESSTQEIALATARRSPARTRSATLRASTG